MSKRYPCERVDLSFIADAPFRFVSTVDLNITPEQLFEVLGDAESWPHWATVITKVTWTSPEPRGVGTTRTVHMRGGITGDEEFLAWEPHSHMAFRFNESTSNTIAAFAEDYRVVETAEGCHLTWVMAMKPGGHRGQARHGDRQAGDVVAVPAIPAQPRSLLQAAVQYSPSHAERLTPSGSATVSSRVDLITRVRRDVASYCGQSRPRPSVAKFSQVLCIRRPTEGCNRLPSGWTLRPR